MLRRLIGDEAFFAGLRRFYRDHRFQKAGTDDFRAAFEAETPITLARFFDRWVTEAAMPRLNVTSRIEPTGKTAIVRIEQLGEPFDFPYTVSMQYTDGRTEDITIPVSRWSPTAGSRSRAPCGGSRPRTSSSSRTLEDSAGGSGVPRFRGPRFAGD